VARGGEVVLVHRPRYDDWSLPKGKLLPGEHPLLGAVREVYEETGVRGVPGVRLPGADYQAPHRGSLVDKHVDFWAMTAVEIDTFTPNDEVNDVAWVPVARALQLLSYPRDERVLHAYAELPPVHRPVVLVRSAAPEQAASLADVLAVLRPGRLISASPVECRDTLGPLSESLLLNIEVDSRFDVGGDPGRAAQALRNLADPDRAVVVCAGGTALADTTRLLAGDAPQPAESDGVVVSFVRDGSAAMVDPLTPA
jgi:8-oxo-dGTP pyrophosphatase MutT (NUDIX family)